MRREFRGWLVRMVFWNWSRVSLSGLPPGTNDNSQKAAVGTWLWITSGFLVEVTSGLRGTNILRIAGHASKVPD